MYGPRLLAPAAILDIQMRALRADTRRLLPTIPRKLKKRMRRSFEIQMLASLRVERPQLSDFRKSNWQKWWWAAWRYARGKLLDAVYDEALEALCVEHDRAFLGARDTAVKGA